MYGAVSLKVQSAQFQIDFEGYTVRSVGTYVQVDRSTVDQEL